jgi:D-beta-D-heptose 7-phosphate kinase/D-beta-D-heptose 1-phosphate adenosyltransferase
MEQKSSGKKKVVAVSGGFDPVHIGHVRMFNEARALGDELVVILNNDNWLALKKGFAFMPQDERKEVIEAFAAVDRVILTSHEPGATDMSVCRELEELRPDIFANGGDRKSDNIPEYALCERLGIEMAFNVGQGGKVQSSSWLIEKAKKNKKAV